MLIICEKNGFLSIEWYFLHVKRPHLMGNEP